MIFEAVDLGASRGRVEIGGRGVDCALGRGGTVAAPAKREGDGATPRGTWALRRVLYRPDRIGRAPTGLPCAPLMPGDGWCDAPGDGAYNRPVRLPYAASAEAMWRQDGLYDVVVVLGHNDDPPRPGLGSAIFLHVATADLAPTEGCVAIALPDLLALLAQAQPGDALRVSTR